MSGGSGKVFLAFRYIMLYDYRQSTCLQLQKYVEEIAMKNQSEIEIDLLDLGRFLTKKLWIIVAVAVLFAAIGTWYTACMMEDRYTADTQMYILKQSASSSTGSLSYSDFQISDKVMQDYMVLITAKNVMVETIERLGLDMTWKELSNKISVSAIGTSRVLQIVVVDTDPQRAADIANCVREVAGRQIKNIMDVDAVNLVYEAEAPTSKSGPSVNRNATLAALVGLLICVTVFTVIYILDDTIRTEEDVERHLGLGVLGVIPASDEIANMAECFDAKGRQRSFDRNRGRKEKRGVAIWR